LKDVWELGHLELALVSPIHWLFDVWKGNKTGIEE
jgi:hypothetical protein